MNIIIKQKQNPVSRNITPSFIRFKKTNHIRQFSDQSSDQQKKITERSSSKNSKCSFDVYQKRILNLSKLKNTVTLKKKLQQQTQSQEKKTNIIRLDPQSKRTSSYEKDHRQTFYNNYPQRQLIYTANYNKINLNNLIIKQRNLKSKRSEEQQSTSRERYSNNKREEQSLERQQQRAKLQNNQLLKNLMRHEHVPNYMNKLKIKKIQTANNSNLKKVINLNSNKHKKSFFQDPTIDLKNEEKLKNYEIYGELGKGAYGIVKMALNKNTKQKVAIKIYQKSKLDQPNKIKNVERQIVILNKINHPTIARLLQTIETQSQLYLILQYGGANSLYKYLLSKVQHRLTEKEAKHIFKIILITINYLHSKNIIHRDIKAENILLNRFKQLKLIDFGFSLMCPNIKENIDTFCGTPTYMAPQIVSKIDHIPIYTDMWSLGILFYVMLQGNYPFRAKTENELFQKIKKGRFQYIYNDISEKSKLIIKGLLNINPLNRFTAKQLMSEQFLQWYDQ